MSGEPIIRVENFNAGFGEKILMKDVNFVVHRGEILAILGGSGSGKSTFLKHMIGLYRPLSGRILLDGDDIGNAEGEARLKILRKFGVMYQHGALFGSMTLLENIRLPLEEYTDLSMEAMDLISRMKLALVALNGFENHMPSELSGGMQTRAAIARAMALDPTILFLDEPSAGLDPITSAELDQLIVQLSRTLGITFVIVTHELASIYAIADRVVMLNKEVKGIVAAGKPEELRDRSDNAWVRRFFNRQVEETPAA
jgi:phospholipid/cholesterol/gamma-HCH transport system ATP-binding protein